MRQTRSTPGSSRADGVDPGASWALGFGRVPPSDAVRRWRPSATRRLASLAGAALRPSNVATTRGATDSPLNGRLRGRRCPLHPMAGTGKSSCRAPARVVDAAQVPGTPYTLVLSPQGTVLRSWMGAYAGTAKTEIEGFFHVKLPEIERP